MALVDRDERRIYFALGDGCKTAQDTHPQNIGQ
jgi:hypothetical protein